MAGERARRAKVGVFGIGLEAYWEQFTGFQERLGGYQQSIEERMGSGPRSSYAAGERFAEERVDLIFCHAGTYATNSSRANLL